MPLYKRDHPKNIRNRIRHKILSNYSDPKRFEKANAVPLLPEEYTKGANTKVIEDYVNRQGK